MPLQSPAKAGRSTPGTPPASASSRRARHKAPTGRAWRRRVGETEAVRVGGSPARAPARPLAGAAARGPEVGERLGAHVVARMRGPGPVQPLGDAREHVPEVAE